MVCVNHGETRISGRERGVCGDCFLEQPDALVAALNGAATDLCGACAKVKIVGFGAGLVAPAAAPELQPKAIDDTAGNLVLDGEDVRRLPVKPRRPQRQVVAYPDQLGVDSQLLAGAKHRAFQDVIGCKLRSHVAYVSPL